MDLAGGIIGFSKRAVGRSTMMALGAMQGNRVLTAGATSALRGHLTRGAMIGAGAGAAMSFGSGVMNGDLSFGGVVGGAFRGAMMGGIGNAGFRGVRALGRTNMPSALSPLNNGSRMLNLSGQRGFNMSRGAMKRTAKTMMKTGNFNHMGKLQAGLAGAATRWGGFTVPTRTMAGGAAHMRMGG
jgi:hypothetical protein